MKKAILISIRHEWVAKILKGEKTIEIRKTAPKCELPVDVYIYCTKGNCGLLGFPPNKETFIIESGGGIWVPKGSDLLKTMRLLNGTVVAKFRLEKIVHVHMQMGAQNGYGNNGYMGYAYCKEDGFRWWYKVKDEACLKEDELCKYLNGGKTFTQVAAERLKAKSGYAWHISDLEIFDQPKELSDFGLERAPQSWQYVEVEK